MKTSDPAIKAIKSFEGLRLKSYKCPAGVWTIGYGHTYGVKSGQVITEKQADSLLRGDLLKFEQGVSKLGVAKTQGQFDALVDFTYNLGLDALVTSTLLKKIRSGAGEEEIRVQFARWVNAGGKPLTGLIKRRKWDADRYFAK